MSYAIPIYCTSNNSMNIHLGMLSCIASMNNFECGYNRQGFCIGSADCIQLAGYKSAEYQSITDASLFIQ